MNRLAQDLQSSFNVVLASEFTSKAIYHHALDFIEYVASDCFVVSERIDEFLTILKDGDNGELVGFKLKGFAYLYNELIKPTVGEDIPPFLELVPVLTYLLGRMGDAAFEDVIQKRKKAYQDVARFARNQNVTIEASELRRAA